MTVSELIFYLRQLPSDADVRFNFFREVQAVELVGSESSGWVEIK